MANTTPYTVELAPGTYTITVSKAGYVTQTRSVTLTAGQTKTEAFTLAVQPAVLTVTSDPDGADVTVVKAE